MFHLLTDEHISKLIVLGLRRATPGLDVVRVQDVGLTGQPDPVILEWAAANRRILISRDRKALIGLALNRVLAGQLMPGVLVLRDGFSFKEIMDGILLIVHASSPDEWKDQTVFLPL